MEDLVRRAVIAIRQRYSEPLGLDDLARAAMMSKYHFIRAFQRVTGITPARFLSAVRIHEAKRLLSTTSLTVADVSVHVGYSSVGSFTQRFTGAVNLTPTQYRRFVGAGRAGEAVSGMGGALPTPIGTLLPDPSTGAGVPGSRLPAGLTSGSVACGAVVGMAVTAGLATRPVQVALFRDRIPEGIPRACAVADAAGQFAIDLAPRGTWYLLAVTSAVAQDAPAAVEQLLWLVAIAGPIRVQPGVEVRVDVTLVPLSWLHPPVLSVLPGLDLPLAEPVDDDRRDPLAKSVQRLEPRVTTA